MELVNALPNGCVMVIFSASSAFLTFGGSVPREGDKQQLILPKGITILPNNSSILVVHRPNPDNPEQIIQSHSIIQVDSSLRRRVGGGRGRGGPIIVGGGVPPPPPPAIVPKRRVVEEPPAMLPSGGDATTTMGNMTPEQASRQFDIHRREATKLERQLEDRVARYQQLAQRFGDGSFSSGGSNNGGGGPSDNDNYAQRGSLLAVDYGVGGSTITNGTANNSSTTTTALDGKLDDEESALSDDIQRTISRMNELINIKMGPMSECTDRAQHVLLVKRYREIVFDCNAEFGRTRAGIARRREARELFSGAATAAGGGLGGDEAERQLLRERNAIDNSMNGASDVLNQAAHVRAELRTQGSNLRGIAGTMGRIAANVPGLNAIIDKIRKKRLQDDRVVGGVVAMCILFTLWYLFG